MLTLAKSSEDDYDELIDIRSDDSISDDEVDEILGSSPKKVEVVRSHFAEVWIWQASADGRLVSEFLCMHDFHIKFSPTQSD